MGPDDMVLCSGTLSRSARFAERVSAASAAGFAGISLWGRDYAAARAEGYDDADLRSMVADHGLTVAELDPAWWWLPGAEDIPIDPALDDNDVFRFGEEDFFAIADALGARSLNAVDVFGGSWDLDGAAEAFAGLCRRAAEHGLLVHLEWLPWSKIPTLAAALAVVGRAGQANGGINVDAWHLVRSATAIEELAAVPGETILAVQIDDGPAQAEENLVEATLHQRALPGEGEFDLAGIIGALRATGTAAPLGVEVFSDRLHELSPAEAAGQASDCTRRILELAR